MIEPRAYQLESLESVLDQRLNGVTRQLISLPTGTGKTVLFSLLAKELDCKTLIVAHREELLSQARDKLQMIWPEVDVGIVKAEIDEIDAQVVIASIQTACRDKRLQRLKEQNFDLMIVDECHHAAADSYAKVIKELGFMDDDPDKLLVGVTATPKRGDGLGLGSIFQKIVFDRSISTMIRSRYLAPLTGKQVFTKVALENVGIKNGDFIQSELSRAVNIEGRNQLVIDAYTQYANDRKKTLVFCADVQHAIDLSDLFNSNEISSKSIYGTMDKNEREEVLKEFSSGKIQVLTNCQVLTEGYDEPSIDCVIMARPTKSSTLYTQMIGRGTRPFPSKKDCLILDFCDNATRNDLCSYKNTLDGVVVPLFTKSKHEDDEQYDDMPQEKIAQIKGVQEPDFYVDRIQNIEFFDNAHFAWNQVGDSWHLILGSGRDVWLRPINGGFLIVAHSDGEVVNLSNGRSLPLDYALGCAEDWSRKQTTKSAWARKDAPWRTQPASQKQLDALAKSGFKFEHGLTKGEACEMLDSKMNAPATDKQLFYLKINGIPFHQGITKLEARKLIANKKNLTNVL